MEKCRNTQQLRKTELARTHNNARRTSDDKRASGRDDLAGQPQGGHSYTRPPCRSRPPYLIRRHFPSVRNESRRLRLPGRAPPDPNAESHCDILKCYLPHRPLRDENNSLAPLSRSFLYRSHVVCCVVGWANYSLGATSGTLSF